MLWLTLRQLKSKEPTIRWVAADKLGAARDPRAFEPLAKLLRDDDEEVFRHAVRALGQLGDPRAVDPLAAVLKDAKTSRNAGTIIEALGALGSARAAEAIAEAMEKFRAPLEACRTLTAIGKPAVEPLVLLVKNSKNENVRILAMEALQAIHDPRALECLQNALDSAEFQTRTKAAQALASLGWQPVDPAQQALFAVACGHYEKAARLGATAVAPLLSLIADPESLGNVKAEEALKSIKDPQALEPLVAALTQRQGLAASIAAARALGQMGDTRAIRPLMALINSYVNIYNWGRVSFNRETETIAEQQVDILYTAAWRGVRDILLAAGLYGWGRVGPAWRKQYTDRTSVVEGCREATRLKPNDSVAWNDLGLALALLGDSGSPTPAVEALHNAVRLNADYVEAWNNLGFAVTFIKYPRSADAGTFYQEAVEAYAQATERKPDYLEAWCNLGITHLLFREPDRAWRVYDRLKKLDPATADSFGEFILSKRRHLPA